MNFVTSKEFLVGLVVGTFVAPRLIKMIQEQMKK